MGSVLGIQAMVSFCGDGSAYSGLEDQNLFFWEIVYHTDCKVWKDNKTTL